MIKKVVELAPMTYYHKICDDCGKEIKRGMACSTTKCEICGKDLCEKCIGYEEGTSGDYRVVYCADCWYMGESHRAKIKLLENKIDKLTDEWHNKCKEKRMEII